MIIEFALGCTASCFVAGSIFERDEALHDEIFANAGSLLRYVVRWHPYALRNLLACGVDTLYPCQRIGNAGRLRSC